MQIFLAFSQKQFTTNNWISYPNDGNVNVSGQWCRGVSIRSEDVRARRLEDVFRVVTLETLIPAKSIFTQWNVSFYEVRICEDQRKYFVWLTFWMYFHLFTDNVSKIISLPINFHFFRH